MKPLTLVLCILAILGSAASTFFYSQIGSAQEQLKQQVRKSEVNADELNAKLAESGALNEGLQKRLAALDSDLGDAKSKLATSDGRNIQLSRDISQIRAQLSSTDGTAQALNNEIDRLNQELFKIKLASASAASPIEVDGYKNQITTLQAKVSELEAAVKLAARNSKSAHGVSAGAVDTAVDNSLIWSGDGPRYEVASVGDGDAFVVIKAGLPEGLQPNQKLMIGRDGKGVAQAIISSVHENFAVAQIIPSSIKSPLVKGDLAITIQ
jgi:septal ring factor EnvC (AmiA/AmiB activator)